MVNIASMNDNQTINLRGRVKYEVKRMKVLHLNMVIRVGDVSLHMHDVML